MKYSKNAKLFGLMILIIAISVFVGCNKSNDLETNSPNTESNTNNNQETYSDEYITTCSLTLQLIPVDDDDTFISNNKLFQAVKENDFELVKSLINDNTDINIKDNRGCPAIYYVSNIKMAEYLINHGAVVKDPERFLKMYYREMIHDKYCNKSKSTQNQDSINPNIDNELFERSEVFMYFFEHIISNPYRFNGHRFNCLRGNDHRISNLKFCGMTHCPEY